MVSALRTQYKPLASRAQGAIFTMGDRVYIIVGQEIGGGFGPPLARR